MVDSVTIEGYKSIRSQEVRLHSMNILLGGNGVGKSNFLSVFVFSGKSSSQEIMSMRQRVKLLGFCIWEEKLRIRSA